MESEPSVQLTPPETDVQINASNLYKVRFALPTTRYLQSGPIVIYISERAPTCVIDPPSHNIAATVFAGLSLVLKTTPTYTYTLAGRRTRFRSIAAAAAGIRNTCIHMSN